MRKQVLVTVDRGETRVAMLEAAGDPAAPAKSRARRKRGKKRRDPRGLPRRGGLLRAPRRPLDRRQHLQGRVDNVLPGLEAAFVDIGLEKNGFLHVDEIVIPGVEQVKRGRGSAAAARSPTCSSRGRRSSSRSSRTR